MFNLLHVYTANVGYTYTGRCKYYSQLDHYIYTLHILAMEVHVCKECALALIRLHLLAEAITSLLMKVPGMHTPTLPVICYIIIIIIAVVQ